MVIFCLLLNPVGLIFAFFITIVVVSLNITRQLLARRLSSRRTADDRQPILYLRSFSNDEKVNAATIFSHFGLFETDEQTIHRFLSQAGPVISIGRPHEILPALGAKRIYIADDDWQNTATDLLKRSNLVVLRFGFTEGLKWEIETAVQLCDPRRVIIYCPLPFGERRARVQYHLYDIFKGMIDDNLPRPLPSPESVGEIIRFTDAWQPVSKKIILGVFGFIRFKARGSRLPYIREAMRPIFMNLHIEVPSCLTASEILWIVWFILGRVILFMIVAPVLLIEGILSGYRHEFGQGITMSIFGAVILGNLWSSVLSFWRQ